MEMQIKGQRIDQENSRFLKKRSSQGVLRIISCAAEREVFRCFVQIFVTSLEIETKVGQCDANCFSILDVITNNEGKTGVLG